MVMAHNKTVAPFVYPLLAGLAINPIIAASSAQAQEAGDTRRATLEEVVITAQKREEGLQDAALSVQALSGDELLERGVFSIKDLQAGAIPSVRIAPFFGRASAVSLSMRGIASGDVTQISRDPSFGIYIDGVYLGRVQGLGIDLLDVERMEVLRGPQGTLFGRNAVGGALSIVSKQPTGEAGLKQRFGFSNFNGLESRTNLDLPKLGDVSIKIDGLFSERDGWVSNPWPDAAQDYDYNASQRQGLRISALWEPAERTDVLYAYDTSRDRQTSGYPHIDSFIDDRPRVALIGVEDGRVSRTRIPAPLRPSVAKVEGHTLHIAQELSDSITLKSITAYRDLDQDQKDQWAGSFVGPDVTGRGFNWTGRYSLATVEQDQVSQELQLLGNTERLQYVLGAFYFKEDMADTADTLWTLRYINDGTAVEPLGLLRPSRGSEAEATSKALFAQATWTPPVAGDRVDLTFGLRYTDDEKSGALVGTDRTFEFDSDRTDPLLVFAYRWNDDMNSYLRWSTAYRAGGANSRSESYAPFGDEEVMAWELGHKMSFLEGRARLNLAAYHMDYDDQQFTFTSPFNPSVSETVNIDDTVKIRGLEADFELAPMPGLIVTLNYAYTDVDSPLVRNPFFDLAPDQVRDEFFQPEGGLTPKHAATAAFDYQFPATRFGSPRARVDFAYSDSMLVSALATEETDSYTLVNGRLTLEDIPFSFGGAGLEVALWGRNILDKEYRYFTATLDATGFSGANVAWYGTPRTYGVDLTLRF
jgi:iron complex outermembrane recepter protein